MSAVSRVVAPDGTGVVPPQRVKPDLATLELERFIRGRRWMWVFVGIAMAGYLPIDWVLGANLKLMVPLRLGGAAFFLAVGFLSGRATIRTVRWLVLVCGVVLSLCIAVSIVGSGGVESPFLLALLVVPFLFTMMMPVEPNATLLVALTNLAGGCVIYAHSPKPLIVWGSLSLMVAVFAYLHARKEKFSMIAQIHRALEHGRVTQQLDESEQRRARSEKLAILGQLSASIAHEINNPLAFVRTNVQFALEELAATAVDPEVKAALAESLTGLSRVDQVIKDLKGLSHDAPVHRVPVEVSRFVAPAVRIAQIRAGTQVRLEIGDLANLPEVLAHEGRLTQVMVNLLVNAIDAVEAAKGCVKLLISAEPGHVRFSVQDNGPGIAPEVLPRLFNAFITTKELGKGTGMGLMLCHDYVTQAGGTLTAANNASGGARFDVLLSTPA